MQLLIRNLLNNVLSENKLQIKNGKYLIQIIYV